MSYSKIDLMPFCFPPDPKFVAFGEPWSAHGFTFATDTSMVIRTPEIPGIPPRNAAPTLKIMALPWPKDHPRLCRIVSAVPADTKETLAVSLGNRALAVKYINKILALPNPRFAMDDGGNYTPIYFVFDGGEGFLMPCFTTDRYAEGMDALEIEEVTV